MVICTLPNKYNSKLVLSSLMAFRFPQTNRIKEYYFRFAVDKYRKSFNQDAQFT
jgi:hypothetical protein